MGWRPDPAVAPRGRRLGMCNPLQPARSPALSEGLGDQGSTRVRLRVPPRPRSITFNPLRLFGQADKLRTQRLIEVEGQDFRAGGSGRRPSP